MNLPNGPHYNISFEPSQASNNYSGSYVIGYFYPDGPHGRRDQTYRVPVDEKLYRRVKFDRKTSKTFYEQDGAGRNKYYVRFHDGVKAYSDGSPLYDIRMFKNKVTKEAFIAELRAQGFESPIGL